MATSTAARVANLSLVVLAGAAVMAGSPQAPVQSGAGQELALQLTDFASLPITGSPNGEGNNAGALARINVMRDEPAPTHRLFVNDLTGPLYILDNKTKAATTYLDLNGRPPHTGLFRRLTYETGLASGFISFEFDPDYAKNGRFYTIHLEDVDAQVSPVPDTTSFPRVLAANYAPTAPVRTPGDDLHEAVLIEWTDSTPSNSTFEGTARELLRVPAGSRFHPMGDLAFNPTARPGDPDWRVLYVACGDSAAGEQRTAIRLNPQRLDNVAGKILRIIPDLGLRVATSTVSENGRYRIPNDNPFTSIDGARKEIWAYGLRNPHRLTWDVDPANPARNSLIATVVGLRTWETVVIIHKGTNYGYSEREGTQMLLPDNSLAGLPESDTIPVRVTDTVTHSTVVPTYPVIQYGHTPSGGDAIAGGFVYRGKSVPALKGRYVLGDTSTGRVWTASFAEMLEVDGSHPPRVAQLQELRVRWDDPGDTPDRGVQTYASMFDVAKAGYHARGGKNPDLPGRATLAPSGRVDLRFAVDRDGELYLLTKSDGVIRKVTGFGPAGAAASAQTVVIKAGRLVDPETAAVLVDQTIVVQSARITAVGRTVSIPTGATTIDLSRATVLPGLFDAHSHLCEATPPDDRDLFSNDLRTTGAYRAILGTVHAREMLQAGFTTVRDVGNAGNYVDSDLRRALEQGLIPGPTIGNAGRIIAPFGGQYHLQPERRELGAPEYLFADTRDEIRKAIRENVHFGARVIKIVVDDQPYVYSVDDIKFIVSEAAVAGLKVAAHCLTERGAHNAAEGGVASIEHGLHMSDETLAIAKRNGVVLVGTDFPEKTAMYLGAGPEFAKAFHAALLDRLKRAYRAGVTMAFGTDSFFRVPGETRGTLALSYLDSYIEAAIPAPDILRMMTTNAARLLGIEQQRGAIRPGLAADIIATPASPLDDITTLRHVVFVMKNGAVIRYEAH